MSRSTTTRQPSLSRPAATLLALLIGAALLVLPAGPAQALTGEGMQSFDVVYDLQPDGSVQVKETIVWQFPPGQERRGIYRNIIVRMGWNDEEGKYRYYEMTRVSVDSPSGAPDEVRVTDNGAAMEIRVGSENLRTSGVQTYVVRYTLAHVLNPIAENDTVEFYYNVFGANELTEREKVTVTVNAPAASTDALCYRGERGAKDTCDATPGEPTRFTASNLLAGDALTVVAQYPANAFANPQPDVRSGDAGTSISPAAAPAANAAAYAAGIGAPLIAAAAMGALVWKRGRDERYAELTPGLSPVTGTAGEAPTVVGGRHVVAVQFQPPKGVQPGMVGTIMDEQANPIDVSATVIDLAVRGFLRIEEIGGSGMFSRTDWTLTRLVPPVGEQLLPFERQLLDGLFRTGDVVTLSELKNHFSSTLKKIQASMYEEVVTRHWFRKSPQTQRGLWQGLGVVVAVLGGLTLAYGVPALSELFGSSFTGGYVLGGGLLVAGGITWFLGGKMAAKTAEGSAVHAQSLGFREYLTTAEAGQIAFEEASNIFSRYLPYAVVFGVADRWAKTFAEVAKAAEAAGQTLVM
ncbi:MAG TPA: DUF2207 domain-containing protein, partial [Dermatophilaceae bacterium]|nr:DUF2207 domain-containing protein [Dermatophilaceae bacterium]